MDFEVVYIEPWFSGCNERLYEENVIDQSDFCLIKNIRKEFYKAISLFSMFNLSLGIKVLLSELISK